MSTVAFFLSDLIKNHLGSVLIKGEISNLQLRKHSAYVRFSLKDSSAKIDCLTHNSSNAAKLIQHLQDGDEVIVFATPSLYTKTGQIAFFTDEMMKFGEGIFRSNLDRLKQKLYEEGLFDTSLKKTLPPYPEHIGVVTSPDGAALQDIIRVANDRYPSVKISVFPSLVQGKDAPENLVKALSKALKAKGLNALIIGRGGGSGEDLEAFNNEELVRLVFSSTIPIVSAVGHETDMTLIDYAADISAPTPTGAAMILFPDTKELLKDLNSEREEMLHLIHNFLSYEEKILQNLHHTLIFRYEKYLMQEQHYIVEHHTKLMENNPSVILAKGYARIVSKEPLSQGTELKIITNTKKITAKIISIKNKEIENV